MAESIFRDGNIFKLPHVVILGAGASRAAFPEGDMNGNELPLMNNLIKVLHMDEIFSKNGVEVIEENFEELYDRLASSRQHYEFVKIVEQRIYDYFLSLELSLEPNIYDYLLLWRFRLFSGYLQYIVLSGSPS